VGEIFNTEVKFDRTTMYRIGGPSHGLPYESLANEEASGSHPAVAILALSKDTIRPLFLKTKTGNQVTHKVALQPGSLCFLSGRSELRYKRSIPKEYGPEQEQFYLISLSEQNVPSGNIISGLKRIPISPTACTNAETDSKPSEPATYEPNSSLITPAVPKSEGAASPSADLELENTVSSPVSSPVPGSEKHVPHTSDQGSHGLVTPPTIKRVASATAPQFQDEIDYNTSDSLLLTATISAVVERMDEDTVTKELIRHQTSITGSLEEKRKRLQQKMCLSIGELSTTATNNSMSHGMSFSRCDSPDDSSTGLIKDNIESVYNAQRCMESTLKHIVESIVNINHDINNIRGAVEKERPTNDKQAVIKPESVAISKELAIELAALTQEVKGCNRRIDDLSNSKELIRSMKDCSGRIKDLIGNLQEAKSDLKTICEDLANMRDNAADVMRKSVQDMSSYYTSVFSDETRDQVKEIHSFLVYPQHASTGVQTEVPVDIIANACENVLRSLTSEVVEDNQPSRPPRPALHNTTFTFPEPIQPSLRTIVNSAAAFDVWLITDSIMRHINEFSLSFRKYRINFERVDKTSSSALIQRNLERKIANGKPHIIYLHLGVNDVNEGVDRQETIDNFKKFNEMLLRVSPSTKLVVSCPLLNGNSHHDRHIFSLRHSLSLLVSQQEQIEDSATKRLYIQKNDKFFRDGPSTRTQNSLFFNRDDLLHLSNRGKAAMTCTMRDTLDKILKDLLSQY
jgi:gas vesicle protein